MLVTSMYVSTEVTDGIIALFSIIIVVFRERVTGKARLLYLQLENEWAFLFTLP